MQILGLLGIYFDAAVVYSTNSSLLFQICSGHTVVGINKLIHPIVSDQKRCLSSPNQNFSNFPTSVLAFLPPTFLNFFLWIFEHNLAFN